MRCVLMVLCTLILSVTSAVAQVSIGIGLPGVSIGINLPLYPELVQVPGYPVYYAPQLNSNYFFYDGMYWVYQDDNWYASDWYNGPWGMVNRDVVPLFVLRIPVRYYRAPPNYFRGWRADAAPRWGDHWGNDWQQRRRGWDQWNRNAVPAAAPLPVYQRQYTGDHYPRVEQQPALRTQNYRYQPRETAVRQHYQQQAVQRAPVAAQPEQRSGAQDRRTQDAQRPAAPQPPQQRPAAVQEQRQQPQQGTPREQQQPRASQDGPPQGRGEPQEDRRGKGQDKGRDKGDDRGQDRNK